MSKFDPDKYDLERPTPECLEWWRLVRWFYTRTVNPDQKAHLNSGCPYCTRGKEQVSRFMRDMDNQVQDIAVPE